MIKKTLPLLLAAGLASSIGCVPDDPEQQDCPDERSYVCDDGTCAADADSCIDDQQDYPQTLPGEVLSMSPGTVLGDSPEQVTIQLRIEDADALQRLLDDGAKFQISLNDSTGEELLDVAEATQADDDKGLVNLVFRPSPSDRVRIRKEVQVQLSIDDEDGRVYAWGSGFLAFPDDTDNIDFEGRTTAQLEGLNDPVGAGMWGRAHQAFSKDLDGDGIPELLIDDIDADGQPRLVVFRCDADDKCSPLGEVPHSGNLVAPTQADDASTPFLAASTGLLDHEVCDPDGICVAEPQVELLSLSVDPDPLDPDDDGDGLPELDFSHSIIDLPKDGNPTWLADTLQPRLLEDAAGQLHPAISIISRQGSGPEAFLTQNVLRQGEAPLSRHLSMEFDGLGQQGIQSALNGQISACPIPGDFEQNTAGLPEGRLISLFAVDGTPMIAAGSTSALFQVIRPIALPDGLNPIIDDAGRAKCELADLDADGHLDLSFSVSTPQGRALLIALEDNSSDSVSIGQPHLLLNGLSDAPYNFYRDDEDNLRLAITQTPPPGEQPEITHEIGLEVATDGDGSITVTITNQAPVALGIPVHDGDSSTTSSIIRTNSGFQRLNVDNSNRAPYANGIRSSDVGGLFLGSEELISSGGSWLAASFSGGLIEGDEDSLLQIDDPKTIIGWLSTTGPFLPLATQGCCDASTPIIIQELAANLGDGADEDDDADGVEAHVLSLIVNNEGEATGLRIQDLAIIDGEPRMAGERELELDFSSAALTSQNVVKFKAGAELSKSIAATDDTDDCDDGDDDVRPDACPAPSTRLLFVLDSGELATALLDGRGAGSGKVSINKLSTSVSGDDANDGDFFFDSLGAATVFADRRPPLAIDVWESVELSQGHGNDQQTITRTDSRILFGDFQGLGHPQILEITPGDDNRNEEVCGETRHLITAGGPGEGDLDTIEAALNREGQPVCLPTTEHVSILDINGDRCQDLLYPESQQALLSRCDGTFEAELTLLPEGSAHLGGDDGWTSLARNHNASRSNRSQGIRTDNDDIDNDDEVIILLPFADGLQRMN